MIMGKFFPLKLKREEAGVRPSDVGTIGMMGHRSPRWP